MAAPSQYYVDSVTPGADSAGNGLSIGASAYATVQYALDDIGTTHGADSSNGDQINFYGANTLSAKLSFSTYGQTPSAALPLVIRGCNSSGANDGTQGELNGGGSYAIIDETLVDNVILADLYLHNCGSNYIVKMDDRCLVYNCRFATSTKSSDGVLYLDQYARVFDCQFESSVDWGIRTGSYSLVVGNYLQLTDSGSGRGVYLRAYGMAMRNILSIAGDKDGIQFEYGTLVYHNTVFGNGTCTGDGLKQIANTNHTSSVLNNIICDVKGVGGNGINWNSSTRPQAAYGFNAFFNNTTNSANEGDALRIPAFAAPDNEELTGGNDPIAEGVTENYANRFTYFAPENVGNVRAGAWPDSCGRSKGAVQHSA